MSRYSAVIFDMDGLLIDSEPLWRRAEIEVLATVGLRLEEADCARTTGLRIDEVVAFWQRQRPWATPSPAVVAGRIVDRVIELVEAEGVLLPGAVAALDFFAVRGLPLGLASSSPWRLIEAVLTCFGLRARFEGVCSAEGMAKGKPDPAVYLEAARRLGHAPSVCVAIEDSVPGVLAAKAAGMGCIAVPAADERDDPRFGRADARLDSLEQLDDARWARMQAA
jgi:mannitol-1-/sugar-/sorbitol-6-/2-deoxyglucose-6-phosphatase